MNEVRKFPTAHELAAFLLSLPGDTEVYVEAGENIEMLSGGAFFPKQGLVSLVGVATEIDVDEDDWDSVRLWKEVATYVPVEDDIPFEMPTKKVVLDNGEVSAPLKP